MEVRTGYKQTEVGIIPQDWSLENIENLAHITTGSRNTQDRVDDGQYPFFVRSQMVERINSYSFDGEAVLTAGDGVGTGKVFHYINGKFDVHQRVYRISDFRINGYFFYLYFSSHFYRRIMKMTAKSSVDSVRREMITGMLIPVPSTKAEQEAIAEALCDTDAFIQSLEQLLIKKLHLKQGAMHELLTGQKRLPGFGGKRGYKQTEVGVIPEDWEILRIRDLVRQGPQNGYSGQSSDDARGTPTLSLAATSSGRLVLNDATVKHLQRPVPAGSILFLEPFDVLVQRSNTIDLVGTTAVFDGPSATYVYPDLMMRLRFKAPVAGQWFWRYANSSRGRRFFRSVAAGSTGSMPKISGEKLREMPVPVPPPSEQISITTILSDMDAEIAAMEAKLAKARQLKQGMMQELLTGRIRLI